MLERVICPFCYGPGGYFGRDKKKGRPYFRCEGCYALVFMNTQPAYGRFVAWCEEAHGRAQSVAAARTAEILARDHVPLPVPIPDGSVRVEAREPVSAKE